MQQLVQQLVRQLGKAGILAALSITAGCFALPTVEDGNLPPGQQDIIANWHRCVDDNLVRLKAEGRSPETGVDHALVACQGHSEDVLGTFPGHLQRSLQKLMVQQTWERGYAAWSPALREVAQSAPLLLR